MSFVSFCWIFFRAPNFEVAWTILHKLAGLAPGGITWTYMPAYLFVLLLAAAHAVGVFYGERRQKSDDMHAGVPAYATARLPLYVNAFLATAWLLILYLFIPLHRSPFIYFQF
jgi:hypothetical protein